ncbi:hypothetical protein A2716_02215 [candidate division WWE3 bacterium RIFCSPHIGHO2_01_FULL_40_23]|nr:MAG: hypothetical protein A2716_02215 [candidate division WWE3 bacterium RIFCSPHIGHO2_01_FULL_40_23]
MIQLDFKHKVKPAIKLKRSLPQTPELCKLSVYANALNFLGFKAKFGTELTPESLLIKVNKERKSNGRKPINPFKNIIPTSDLEQFFKQCNLGLHKDFSGAKYMNFDLWKKLVNNKFLIAPDHQELYLEPQIEKLYKLLPPNVLKTVISGQNFSYKSFIEFYDFTIRYYGPIDEGHVDIVVDLFKENGIKYVVFANLNSVNNKEHVKVPWNLFSKYLSLDWGGLKKIKDTSVLPSKKEMIKLRKEGELSKDGFEFSYGLFEVFYKKEQEETLHKIINEFV